MQNPSYKEHKIAWYENTDGKGTFGPRQIVATETNSFSWSVSAADVDGDSDQDILLASSYVSHAVAWYENTDGKGTFGPQQVIATRTRLGGGASSVSSADMDADGDLDVLSASYSGAVNEPQMVVWYENIDGSGAFGLERVIAIPNRASGELSSIAAADLDGDGDVDILFAATRFGATLECCHKIAWHENTDGQGTFLPREARQDIRMDSAKSIAAHDVDGDGDVDIVSASSSIFNVSNSAVDDVITWYENTDGKGTFGPAQVITTQSLGENVIATGDLDGDGDLDILSASSDDGRIAWYEQRVLGDANDDGVFNSLDLVRILQAGEYNDAATGNSAFDEGDWNGDGEFNSADLVQALQAGHYVDDAEPSTKEFAAAADRVFAREAGKDY